MLFASRLGGGHKHPHELLLTGQIVAHQRNGRLVARLGGKRQQLALLADEVSERIEHQPDGLVGAGDAPRLGDARLTEVLAETVLGHTAEGENPLGQFVGLGRRIVVELLEFGMEDEEAASLDIPVQSAQVGVENLIVGQQALQRCYDSVGSRRVQVQLIHRFHGSGFYGL